MKDLSSQSLGVVAVALLFTSSLALADKGGIPHTKTPLRIKSAEWSQEIEVLRVQGKGQYRCVIEIYNAGNGVKIGETEVPPGKNWFVDIPETAGGEPLDPVPCRVGARQVGTEYCQEDYDSMDVQDAPDDCGPEVLFCR